MSVINFKSFKDLCDVVSAFVYCETDNTILLVYENNEYWIPSAKASDKGMSWLKCISKEIKEIFTVDSITKIMKISKMWYPNSASGSLLHVVFQANVDINLKNKSKSSMGKYRGKLRWVIEQELYKMLINNTLKSPELTELLAINRSYPLPTDSFPDEASALENYFETTNDIVVAGKGNSHFQLVEVSGIDKIAQEYLAMEFALMCFPASYMCRNAFGKLMIDLGWTKDDVPSLFYAADVNKKLGLSFRDLLFFLAAVDPHTSHGGVAAEIRCRYMFKYYDKDKDNFLNNNEFYNLIADIRKSKKQPCDKAAVDKEANDTYKSMGYKLGANMNITDFLKAVCDLKIRGTSTVFRSVTGIIKHQKNLCEATSIESLDQSNVKSKLALTQAQKVIKYEIAYHALRIQREGTAMNIDELKQISEALSFTTLKQPFNEKNRRVSMDLFNQRSPSNELLKGLRYLTNLNKISQPKAGYSWGQLDPNSHIKNLINVCNQVKEVFKGEPRLLEVTSPVYILGDFHGNISDLLYFEKVLWHIGPGLSPSNFLFLGDYVDRGAYSLEVISYLFAYKLQTPNKVYLLRGNHEIREIQKMFTFHKECLGKLGDKVGNDVWNAINNVFDHMPIAAVIDGKVFCCHGGVPPPWLCPVISAINDIPIPLNQPDIQSSLAWELMWNDPVRTEELNDKLTMELLANEGFAMNTRRGTAHVFSVEALERFLKANRLSHLIRAHEVAQAGFKVLQKGQLLTVFSSSKYCGGLNDAACIMADQGKLRVIRLETD